MNEALAHPDILRRVKQWLTLAQAGRRFGLSRSTLYRLIRAGRVETAKKGGDARLYVSLEDLQRVTSLELRSLAPWVNAGVSIDRWRAALAASWEEIKRTKGEIEKLWARPTFDLREYRRLNRNAEVALQRRMRLYRGDKAAVDWLLERRRNKR